ncbi:MAG TPA: ADP-ribosyl-[dinitrogen reductase] hydrolase [Acidiferrobacteraceae bacterium]|nr:ADP-ribosyl-[dinitrogen reductase] hydrolase [Acidiferrobacteraceae bacterium]HEX20495.1 ADP-ribosyl-[dinitrogen reductase] hydrolase [Acidiferrobacteraceae bacterium]
MNESEVKARAVGAYLGLAIGDALGATVEFMTPREIQAQYGTHNAICGGGWLKLKRGQVTDDTTMALALGDSILETGRVDAHAAAQAFDDWMRAKPADIGHTVRHGIIHFRQTGDPCVPENEYDAGNGACMRTLPVALVAFGLDAAQVQAASHAQAHITHNNPLSDAGTECVIAMVQAALEGVTITELLNGLVRELITAYPEFRFRGRRRDNPSAFIVETLQAVLQALFDTGTFEDCLVDVVNRGGDADTTGAIAGMIAGALYGSDAIPGRWLKALDRTVRDACRDQALALLTLSPRFVQR